MKAGLERILVTVLTALVVGLVAADETPDQREVLEYESRPQQNVIPDPEIPVAPAPPSVPAQGQPAAPGPPRWRVDETRLWHLLEAGRLDELEEGIAATARRYPDWRPPARLTRLLEQALQRQALAAAEGTELISLAKTLPGRFTCREIDNLWRLADAYAAEGRSDEALAVYRRILADCDDRDHRLATLQKGVALFPADEYRRRLDEEYARNPGAELGRMLLDARRAAATDAATAGRFQSALDLMDPVLGIALAARDVDSARLLGWSYEQTGEKEKSLDWLRLAAEWTGTSTDRLTLAFALTRAGHDEEAASIVEGLAEESPEARHLLRDILVSRASRSAGSGDCAAAVDLYEEASRLAELTPADESQRAWALYDCERFDESSAVFTDLYVSSPDDAAARGLVFSDWRRHRLDHTWHVAEAHGGPLQRRLPDKPLPRRRGDIDYGRLTLTEDGRVEILLVREWAALAGIGWSTRQGDGPSRLDAWRAPVMAFEYRMDRHRFALVADRLDLDSDDMGPGDFPVNTDRVTGVQITDSESGPWEPLASWVYEGDLLWRAEVGATPVEGEVSATWQGRLGAARLNAGSGWSLDAVRVPVEESILSWTGARGRVEVDGSPVDLPFSWGRVTRNGVDANGYLGVSDRWTLSGDLKVGDYRGHNVESNFGGQFYGLAERRLDGEGDAGLWAGPYVYLSGFEDNRSKFAPGHGGYFSPSWLAGAGIAARWRRGSTERPWYFEARGSAGYQRHEEDATDLIPDDGLEQRVLNVLGLQPEDLGGFGSNTEGGFAGTLELEGLRRIGRSDWHVGGFVRGRVSPEFDNAAAMVTIRYGLPQPRHTIRRQFRERFVNMGQ
jgi:tetratricopeptide (TPR) repeat protein